MTPPTPTKPEEIRVALRTARTWRDVARWYAYKASHSLWQHCRAENLEKSADAMLRMMEIADLHPSLATWINDELAKIGGMV